MIKFSLIDTIEGIWGLEIPYFSDLDDIHNIFIYYAINRVKAALEVKAIDSGIFILPTNNIGPKTDSILETFPNIRVIELSFTQFNNLMDSSTKGFSKEAWDIGRIIFSGIEEYIKDVSIPESSLDVKVDIIEDVFKKNIPDLIDTPLVNDIQEEKDTILKNEADFFIDSEGNQLLKAYTGEEPFIFVSYSHVDSKRIYKEIKWLYAEGYNIWYDEGIPIATQWATILPEKIKQSHLFMIYLSPNSIKSRNVYRELEFAISRNKEIFPVYLDKIDLPLNFEFNVRSIQGIMKYELEEPRYRSKILEALRRIF